MGCHGDTHVHNTDHIGLGLELALGFGLERGIFYGGKRPTTNPEGVPVRSRRIPHDARWGPEGARGTPWGPAGTTGISPSIAWGYPADFQWKPPLDAMARCGWTSWHSVIRPREQAGFRGGSRGVPPKNTATMYRHDAVHTATTAVVEDLSVLPLLQICVV